MGISLIRLKSNINWHLRSKIFILSDIIYKAH